MFCSQKGKPHEKKNVQNEVWLPASLRFPVGSCSSLLLHSFKLGRVSVSIRLPHCHPKPAKSPAGQQLCCRWSLTWSLLRPSRALGLEEGVPPGTGRQGRKPADSRAKELSRGSASTLCHLNTWALLGAAARCATQHEFLGRPTERLGWRKQKCLSVWQFGCHMRGTPELLEWQASCGTSCLGPRDTFGPSK